MLDCEMFGLDAGSHHLMSVVLHAITATALFLLLLRITGAEWPSAFVAFVFGLHPLHVESVAWAAERKDVLSALFAILTLWAYVSFVKLPSRKKYFIMAGLFACGLMAKSMLVTLPFLMLILDYWPLRRKINRAVVMEKVPLIALSLAMSVVTFLAQKHGGAVSALDQISLPMRIENALVSYVLYIVKFVWPAKLAIFYPYPDGIPAWQWIGAAVVLAAVSVAALRRPYALAGWLWYLGMLVPVIGFVQVGAQSHADRYTYLPSIGLAIAIAWSLADFKAARFALTALGCLWMAMTWIYVHQWRNSETVFRNAIEVTDRNWVAFNNLGGTLRRRGDLNNAIANFEKAVSLRPNYADLQDNLGEALSAAGRLEEGITHLTESLRIDARFAKAHVDLGAALMKKDRKAEAIDHFAAALQIDPNFSEAHFRLGGALASLGRTDEATPFFKAALPYLIETARLNPNDPEAHHNLGGVYGMLGQMDEAVSEFRKAVGLRPGDPEEHYNLALALGGTRPDQAIVEFARAVQLKPDYMMAHYQAGKLFAAMGRNAEAQEAFTRALKIDPDFEPAKQGLAELK